MSFCAECLGEGSAGIVVLEASWPGVMSKSWGPVVGSARPWVELASLPPAVAWELADVTDSGGSVFPTEGQRAGAGAAHSSGTLPLS